MDPEKEDHATEF